MLADRVEELTSELIRLEGFDQLIKSLHFAEFDILRDRGLCFLK